MTITCDKAFTHEVCGGKRGLCYFIGILWNFVDIFCGGGNFGYSGSLFLVVVSVAV